MKIFWLVLLVFPLQILAQISVTGTITDANNGQPISYATI